MIIEIQDDFDLKKIIDSGQCFRARQINNNCYFFVTGEDTLVIQDEGQGRYDVSCDSQKWDKIWALYFDLYRDYKAVRSRHFKKNAFIDEAICYARGIRVLRQDPWETLVSFIISQRKSIPAIRKSVEILCSGFGHVISSQPVKCFSFPTAAEMSGVSEAELKACGLGYRAGYVADAVRKVFARQVRLDALSSMTDQELLAVLETIDGVGKKVANCVALFAYGRTSCVPIDVWIAKAINEECCGNNPFDLYQDDAGIIQQYVFYYEKRRQ